MGIEDRHDRHARWGRDSLLEEIEQVGWTRPRAAVYGLGPHTHLGWEFCWLKRGVVDWWVGEQAYHVQAGHVYVTRPGELHGGVHHRLEPCDLYWLQILPPRKGRWPGLDAATTRHLVTSLDRLPNRVFPGTAQLTEDFEQLLTEHRRARDLLAVTSARSTLHRLLTRILRASELHAEGRRISPAISAAIAYGLARLERGLAVAELATAARLSPSRFHDRFLSEVGESPAEWLRRRRIDQAKRRLATTDTAITRLALDLGFPSSQYFATVFRSSTGLTPSEWRRRALAAPT